MEEEIAARCRVGGCLWERAWDGGMEVREEEIEKKAWELNVRVGSTRDVLGSGGEWSGIVLARGGWGTPQASGRGFGWKWRIGG